MKISLILLGALSFVTPVFAVDTGSPQPPARHFKIIQTVEPAFPVTMKLDGVAHGSAKAVLHVDSHGQLVDSLIVAYSKRPFAEEATRAIKQWKFEPEYVGGEPVDTVTEITINFDVRGVLIVQRYPTTVQLLQPQDEAFEYQACSIKNLDAIPAPVSMVKPSYPAEWADKGITGKVRVDFYIDETGMVRFAAAASGSSEMLADIAVDAVKQWRFAPPTKNGRPALVHAQQVFNFYKETAKTAN